VKIKSILYVVVRLLQVIFSEMQHLPSFNSPYMTHIRGTQLSFSAFLQFERFEIWVDLNLYSVVFPGFAVLFYCYFIAIDLITTFFCPSLLRSTLRNSNSKSNQEYACYWLGRGDTWQIVCRKSHTMFLPQLLRPSKMPFIKHQQQQHLRSSRSILSLITTKWESKWVKLAIQILALDFCFQHKATALSLFMGTIVFWILVYGSPTVK